MKYLIIYRSNGVKKEINARIGGSIYLAHNYDDCTYIKRIVQTISPFRKICSQSGLDHKALQFSEFYTGYNKIIKRTIYYLL